MPEFEKRDDTHNYLYIVQNSKEEQVVKERGGNVVFNIETYIKAHLKSDNAEEWEEPSDFKELTNFGFSPIYSDRYLINFSFKRRHQIAGGLFKGFSDLFNKLDIHYLISEPVALFSTHILFYLTLKNGGNPRLWSSTFFPNSFLFSERITISKSIDLKISKSEDQLKEQKKEILSYLEGIIEDKKGPAYHFSFAKKRSVLDTFFKTRKGNSPIVVKPGLKSIFLQFLRYGRAKVYNLLFPMIGDFQTAASYKEHWFYFQCLLTSTSYYDKMPEEYNEDAVIYPLQYEPEASILYFAPDFCDQFVVIENILKSLPHNKILYVKEHPNQFGALGLSKWKTLRKKFHNLRFIYGRESGRKLIKYCNVVTCISSSAGMDGLVLGKRVVLVGDVYYQNYTGAQKAHSYYELNKILNDTSTYNYKGHTLAETAEDLMMLAERSHVGFPYASPTLFAEENLTKIVNAIQKEFI